MSYFQAVVLAVIQGLTEFWPVSSSGHLILVPHFAEWPDQGIAFDVAVHVGTLLAVVLYFRDDLQRMVLAWFRSLRTRQIDTDARLAWGLIIGSIPVGIVGLLFNDYISSNFRSPLVVAVTLSFFGALLWIADRAGKHRKAEQDLQWRDLIIIGCAQALALVPGTSRSGITMTAGLLLGLNRTAAARFSFLLSVPAIGMAGVYQGLKLIRDPGSVNLAALGVGVAVSAITGYVCIRVFLGLVQKIGFTPFVLYRFAIAGFIAVVFL